MMPAPPQQTAHVPPSPPPHLQNKKTNAQVHKAEIAAYGRTLNGLGKKALKGVLADSGWPQGGITIPVYFHGEHGMHTWRA
jgi:hypothetical protein